MNMQELNKLRRAIGPLLTMYIEGGGSISDFFDEKPREITMKESYVQDADIEKIIRTECGRNNGTCAERWILWRRRGVPESQMRVILSRLVLSGRIAKSVNRKGQACYVIVKHSEE